MIIYLILYSIVDPDKLGHRVGGLYHGWARSLSDAKKIFDGLILTPDCCRKEIWEDNGNGYRRLIVQEEYKGA